MKTPTVIIDNIPAAIEDLEYGINILKLVTRNTASEAITGGADVASQQSLLRGVLDNLKTCHETLSDVLFWARKQRESQEKPKPRYFTFKDGQIYELSIEEAKACGRYDPRDEEGWPDDDEEFEEAWETRDDKGNDNE